MTARFFQFHLRTSDVEGARAFYRAVLGDEALPILQLHEQAVARGARPHWLGSLQVPDVDAGAAAFVERGATLLGPKFTREGVEMALMLDPGRAVMALATPLASQGAGASTTSQPPVVWHVLNTPDVARAKQIYAELFGWEFGEPLDLGELGTFHPFSWERGAAPVGLLGGVEGRPGVSPHWLFHLRVADLESAVGAVRDGGGKALEPLTLPDGLSAVVCEDAQGAAFALLG